MTIIIKSTHLGYGVDPKSAFTKTCGDRPFPVDHRMTDSSLPGGKPVLILPLPERFAVLPPGHENLRKTYEPEKNQTCAIGGLLPVLPGVKGDAI